MKKVQVQELSEKFSAYGSYAKMVNPTAYHFGDGTPIRFFRDMLPLDLGGSNPALFSICQVDKRPLVVDVTEYHSHTAEGILPLDADIVIHVMPAWNKPVPPLDQLEAFRVPRGTMVTLNAGTWHHAPFVVGAKTCSTLIVLPGRTYANDCFVHRIPDADQVKIEG